MLKNIKLKKFTIIIVIFLTIISLLLASRTISKYKFEADTINFALNLPTFYFNSTIEKNTVFINSENKAKINLTVRNNDGTNYTKEDIDYIISIKENGSDNSPNFKFSINSVNSTDDAVSQTITGNIIKNEDFEIIIEPDAGKNFLNEQEIILTVRSTSPYLSEQNFTISILKHAKANKPILSQGIVPVKWNGTNWIVVRETDPTWYNYINQEENIEGTSNWANMMLMDELTTTNYTNDQIKAMTRQQISDMDGEIVTNAGSMYVWIPRYAYSVTSGYHKNGTLTNGAGSIDVEFLEGKSLTREGLNIGATPTFDNATQASATKMTNFVVHPAFKYGDVQIEGIWISKFQSSNKDSYIKSAPSVTAWRNITISNVYDKCINMNNATNASRYGINTSDELIDPHLLKNSEWGAVAYLTQSSYGRNGKEISINNNTNYITGISSGLTTTGGDTNTTNTYTTNVGVTASTTKNVTGIYDLSGGAWECVAAYINTTNSKPNGTLVVNAKPAHKDVYNPGNGTSANAYLNSNTFFGDAIYETSKSASGNNSWYSDACAYPQGDIAFFLRGGVNNKSTGSGIYAFDRTNGYNWQTVGFRTAICVLEDFHFNATISSDTVQTVNNKATVNLEIANNDGHNYSKQDIEYTISIKNTDNTTCDLLDFKVDNQLATNDTITKTITGNSFVNDNLELEFNLENGRFFPNTKDILIIVESNSPEVKRIELTLTINRAVPFKFNSPILAQAMIPVKWNGTNWIITNENDTEWYNYVDQAAGVYGTSNWANIMLKDEIATINYTNDQIKTMDKTQIEAIAGETITTLGSMYVWIPRYAYSIITGYHKNGTLTNDAGIIKVEFLEQTSSTKDGINIGNNPTFDNADQSLATGMTNYVLHPAFTYGTKQLTGIWVSKFEASNSNSNIRSVPEVLAWRSLTIEGMYTNSIEMNNATNAPYYGISSNDLEIDPHLLKNSEWGAVAYLAQSSYGRNGEEITINNSYITGRANFTAVYSDLNGVIASTTKNITGIYDMSGCSWEYVAAYLDNNLSLTALTSAREEYRDLLSVGATDDSQSNYNANKEDNGRGVYGTSSGNSGATGWFGDGANYPQASSKYLFRGGNKDSGTRAGLFCFDRGNGGAGSAGSFGFRTCLVVL